MKVRAKTDLQHRHADGRIRYHRRGEVFDYSGDPSKNAAVEILVTTSAPKPPKEVKEPKAKAPAKPKAKAKDSEGAEDLV